MSPHNDPYVIPVYGNQTYSNSSHSWSNTTSYQVHVNNVNISPSPPPVQGIEAIESFTMRLKVNDDFDYDDLRLIESMFAFPGFRLREVHRVPETVDISTYNSPDPQHLTTSITVELIWTTI